MGVHGRAGQSVDALNQHGFPSNPGREHHDDVGAVLVDGIVIIKEAGESLLTLL
jgi:hypothetical protein